MAALAPASASASALERDEKRSVGEDAVIKQLTPKISREELVAKYRQASTCDIKPNETTKGSFRVMTWNIHNGFADYNNPRISTKRKEMMRILGDPNNAVVCLQEVTPRFVTNEDLTQEMKELGFPYSYFANADDIYLNGFFGQATFSRFPILQPHTLSLGRDPIQHEHRVAAICQIEIEGKLITVVNAHLDVWDGSDKTRASQVEIILVHLKSFSTFPTLLLGDFNTVRSPHIYNHDIINDYSPEHWQWIENNRKSRGKEFNPHALQLLIKNGFYDVFDRTKSPSGITTWSFVRVDYIWVNSLIVVHKAGKVNCALSDHYPVYADISILNPQPSPEEATLWSIEHIESFLRWVNGVAGEQRNLELAKPNLKEGKTIQIQTKEEIDYSTIFNQIISVWVQSSDYSRDIRNFFVQGQWPNFAPGHKDVFSPSIQSIAKQLLESAPLQKLIALRMFWEVMTSRSKVISIKTFANDVWLRRGIAGKLMAPYLQTRPDGSQFVANVLSSWTTHLSVAKDFDPRGEGQLIAIVPKDTKYWFVNSFGEEEYIIPGGHFDFKYHDKMRFHVLIYVPGFQDFAWPGDSKDDKIRTDFQTAVITQVLPDWFARVHIQATTTVGDITNHIVQFINENRNLMGDNFPLDPRSWGKYPLYSNIVIRRLVDALKPKDYKGDLLAPLSSWFEREFDTASANQWVLKPDNVRLPKDLTLQFIIDWVIRSENLSIRKQPDALPTTTQELRKVAKNVSTYSWLLLFPNYDAAIQTLYDIFPDPTGKRIVRKLEFLTVFKQRFLMPMYKQVMTIMQKKLSQQEQDAQLELITRSDKRIRDILHAKSVPISAMNLAAIVFQIIVEQKESERLHALNIPLPPARAFAVPPPLSGGFF